MIDVTFQPAGVLGLPQRVTTRKTPAIQQVQSSSASGNTTIGSRASNSNRTPTELQRKLAENKLNERLVGPPPSFQANVLEVESDLNYAIQQLDLKRELHLSRELAPHQEPATKVDEPMAQPDPVVHTPTTQTDLSD